MSVGFVVPDDAERKTRDLPETHTFPGLQRCLQALPTHPPALPALGPALQIDFAPRPEQSSIMPSRFFTVYRAATLLRWPSSMVRRRILQRQIPLIRRRDGSEGISDEYWWRLVVHDYPRPPRVVAGSRGRGSESRGAAPPTQGRTGRPRDPMAPRLPMFTVERAFSYDEFPCGDSVEWVKVLLAHVCPRVPGGTRSRSAPQANLESRSTQDQDESSGPGRGVL